MTALSAPDTEQLTRRALRLAKFTVVYNIVEGLVSITAGITAGLVSLIGFGFDSGIESATAILVGIRLAARLRHGEADEVKERRALKFVSVTFFILAAYVVTAGIRDLVVGERPSPSPIGIGLLIASVIVMPILATMKKRVGTAWIDPIAGFVIALFAINEGREAWHSELDEHDHHSPNENEAHAQ
jgi:divalent metal cation (Fe/Co/Zn/Cd) transporter